MSICGGVGVGECMCVRVCMSVYICEGIDGQVGDVDGNVYIWRGVSG